MVAWKLFVCLQMTQMCLLAVNSEVNARRIANVEACFGSSGQPLAMPGKSFSLSKQNHLMHKQIAVYLS